MAMYVGFVYCVLVTFLTTASAAAVVEETPSNTSQTTGLPQVGLCEVFNPCLNEGKCLYEEAIGRSCRCSPGFRGSRCQFVDFCHGSLCNSTGICHSEKDSYTCECFPGYIGKNCNIPDPCLNTTCNNGGTCVVRDNISFCECAGPFTGKQCDLNCSSSENCNRGGKECVRYNSGNVDCRCTRSVPRNSTACVMEDDLVNECLTLSNPCNGGHCIDRYEGFSCRRCPIGRSGPRCEIFHPCFVSPCQNGGSCLPRGDSYVCSCPQGYQGKLCQWHEGSEVCNVICNATYFEVTCNASLLPQKVQHEKLFTRASHENPACTCKFPDSWQVRSSWYERDYLGYPRYRIVRDPCIIPFDSCGSKVQVEEGYLIYDNVLRFNDKPRTSEQLEDWESDILITRSRGQFQMNLQCRVQTHVNAFEETQSDDFEVDNDLLLDLNSRIDYNILSISYFRMNETLYPAAAFSVDHRLYALVYVDDSYNTNSQLQDKQLSLRDCFATPTANSQDKRRYYLLKNGCPKDKTFRFETDSLSSGQLELRSGNLPKFMAIFSFRPFTFKRLGTQLFVHCDADLCSSGNCNLCNKATSLRRKRHANNEIPLTMAEAAGLEYKL